MTQHERIIRHLESGYTLTQAEAFMEYGIGRLSSRICELRKLGYPIKGEFITKKNRYGEPCTFVQYSMDDGEKEDAEKEDALQWQEKKSRV